MAQPVKLSDALVLEARLQGEVEQRSIAGQVEYWAKLGKVLDKLIDGQTRSNILQKSGSATLSSLLDTVHDASGKARLQSTLESLPFPHFEAHPERKGMLVRTEADGSRTTGRFVGRQFVAESAAMAGEAKVSAKQKVAKKQGQATAGSIWKQRAKAAASRAGSVCAETLSLEKTADKAVSQA